MAQVRGTRPGYEVIHPNRDRLVCRATRLLVVAILLASVGLMLAVTIGGWSKLQGMTPLNFAWCAIYLVIAFYVLRWARGLLPIAAGLALLLLAIAVIAGSGVGGTSWFDRSHSGFSGAHALGGGQGLSADLLGTLVILLIPVELALIVAAIVGFLQGWNVELEVEQDQARRRPIQPSAGESRAAAT